MFKVAFSCVNCGYDWEETFEQGDRVERATSYGPPYLLARACTRSFSCDKCHAIRCPNCKLTTVKDGARTPGVPA